MKPLSEGRALPEADAFRDRMQAVMGRYPYLVAELDGRIAGYAYARPFVGREAYDWSAEVTVYVDKDIRGGGIGRKLYDTLESYLKRMGVLNLYACIGIPETEDEYLTRNSIEFHQHMGYRQVGLFRNCGYKFGRWYHMAWAGKMIGEHHTPQKPIINFSQL